MPSRTTRRRTARSLGPAAAVVFVAATFTAAATIGVDVARANYHDHVTECTVTGRQPDHGPGRIYTAQCGPLDDTDPPLVHKTVPTGQAQAELVPGGTYLIEIVGWDQPAINQHPIIVGVYGRIRT